MNMLPKYASDELEEAREIAEQMKRIFKDEQLRNNLIEAGKIRSKLFTWDKTAALLWEVIEQTVCK